MHQPPNNGMSDLINKVIGGIIIYYVNRLLKDLMSGEHVVQLNSQEGEERRIPD